MTRPARQSRPGSTKVTGRNAVRRGGLWCLVGILGLAAPASADRLWQPATASGMDGVTAGEVVVEPATLHSIGLRWPIRGDDNGNARVAVAYRTAGDAAWSAGYPLFWIHPERQPAAERVAGGRLFAGSIVDLTPGTTYEVRLALEDPDSGGTERIFRVTTRPVPRLPEAMRDIAVSTTPDLVAALAAAQPGDRLRLAAGTYRVGTIGPAYSGTAERPLVIQGPADGTAVLDGQGADILLDLIGMRHVWVENLALRGARVLLRAENAEGLVIRRNRFDVANLREADAITFLGGRATGFLITDNAILGPNRTWPRKPGYKTLPDLMNGIAISGTGHDIAYNRIERVGDGINSGRGKGMRATDIYNNDIDQTHTECIEADYATTNVRIYRNRLSNCLYGVSTQPAQGGPVYVFRNMIFNMESGPFKLHNHTSGTLLFHNTSVQAGIPVNIRPARETVNDVISRNNIYVGTESPALRTTGRMRRCDFDNDGFAYGIKAGAFARWNERTYRSPLDARLGGEIYAGTGAVMLMAGRLFADGPLPPRGPIRARPAADNRPLLRDGARAVDRGVALPGFNGDFAGAAPDLGCCEAGRAPWPVGPRPR